MSSWGALAHQQGALHHVAAVVDFKGIPLEQVNRLTEVLTGELPPVPKVPLLEKLLPQA